MRRDIILDTETTGLDWSKGDRIIEIGCVELINFFPTGAIFHEYIDPQREVHPDAVRVHGVTNEMLRGKPLFGAVAQKFLDFIGDATLVIHNASFDMGFINAELARLDKPAISMERVVDTLQVARRKHPGSSNSLDALCARYNIDNSRRTKHGALLDAELLGEVYAELSGARQAGLDLAQVVAASSGDGPRLNGASGDFLKARPEPLPQRLSEQELAAHAAFVATLGPKAVWDRYMRDAGPAGRAETA